MDARNLHPLIVTIFVIAYFVPNATAQHFQPDRPHEQTEGQYLTDSTYYFLGNTFGESWFKNKVYRVTKRNDAGNVLQAFDHEYDTINLKWYQQRKYEGSFLNDTIRKVWLTWVKNTATGYWILSDSIHFNIHGSPTISWFKIWDPEQLKFVGGKLSEYIYNEQGVLHLTYNHVYDTIDESWQRENYEVVFYNRHNLDSLRQTFYWNGLAWIKDQQRKYTYTPKLFLAEEFLETWNGVEWANEKKLEYVYSDELLDEVYDYNWQPDLGEWMYNKYSDYTYNPDETTYQVTVFFWNGSDWLNTTRKTYQYDPNQLLIEILNEFWSFASEIWKNVSLNTYTYHEPSGNRQQYSFFTWDTDLEQWINYYREHNFWTFYPYPSVPEIDQSTFEIFPNPSNGYFHLGFNNQQQLLQDGLLMIYTTNGRLIKTIQISHSQSTINATDLSPGFYQLVLRSKNGVSRKSLIISK